jgi:hypothetical protein
VATEPNDRAISAIKVKLKAPRAFDLVVDITGRLEGDIDDWPANIQDGIYRALHRIGKEKGIWSMRIVQSRCGRDAPDENWYIHVVAVEEL